MAERSINRFGRAIREMLDRSIAGPSRVLRRRLLAAQRRLTLFRVGFRSRAVIHDRLTYLAPAKIRRIEAALREIDRSRADGDLIEFGVALGGSGIIIAHRADRSRRFFGLDVFDMIPAPSSAKDDDRSRQRYATIRAGKSKGIGGGVYYGYRQDLFSEVRASFERHGIPVDDDRVNLRQGLFEETWPTLGVERVAFAHIDCDWYDPVRFCLNVVAERMSPGGLIVIDDYYDYGGCRTAVDEFLATSPGFAFKDGPNPILQKL